jgi:hypothetical protein
LTRAKSNVTSATAQKASDVGASEPLSKLAISDWCMSLASPDSIEVNIGQHQSGDNRETLIVVQNISLAHTGLKQSGPTCCTLAGTGARPAKEVGEVALYMVKEVPQHCL